MQAELRTGARRLNRERRKAHALQALTRYVAAGDDTGERAAAFAAAIAPPLLLDALMCASQQTLVHLTGALGRRAGALLHRRTAAEIRGTFALADDLPPPARRAAESLDESEADAPT